MNAKFEKIVVMGLGYIGLPTAAVLASREIKVVGVDINPATVETINAGQAHIVEPDLDIIVRGVVNTHYLRASILPEPADAFLITVPTPFNKNHEPDLSYVEAAVQSIAPVLKKGNLIVLESTVPVGTTEQISRQLVELRNDLIFPHQDQKNPDINITYCPERVMPGKILRELTENDRIIGGFTERCAHQAKELYKLFVKGECITTDCRTAEMAKLTENAFRDVNIAFANEISIICDKLKINVWELIKLANRHPRVNILQPGAGVGGHCIAVDPWFIVNAVPKEAKLIRAAREVNDSKPKFILEKIKSTAAHLSNPTIACLGLTYKPNTDDLRESPAVEIVHQLLLTIHANLLVVEPNIKKLPFLLSQDKHCELVAFEKALEVSDILVLLVNHKEFMVLNELIFQKQIIISAVSDYQQEPMIWLKNEKPPSRAIPDAINELVILYE